MAAKCAEDDVSAKPADGTMVKRAVQGPNDKVGKIIGTVLFPL